MRIVIVLLFLLEIAFTSLLPAQVSDTLRVMQYNLLNFGNAPAPCNTQFKINRLRIIVPAVNPHIFGCNEVYRNPIFPQAILDSVLNYNGVTYWRQAAYTAPSNNSDLVNMLFYDSRYLELKGQEVITGGVRDVNVYHLKHKFCSNPDSIYLSVIITHLKAGNTPNDATLRASQANLIKNYLNNLSNPQNIIVMGDFNVYTSSEVCYQHLVANTNLPVRMYDPIDMPGNWSNDPTFAPYHTQAAGDQCGGSGGGLDDRFDFILINDAMRTNSKGIQYVANSYRALGQNGQLFNQNINNNNTSISSTLANALYMMSDHLPVYADFAFRCNSTVERDFLLTEVRPMLYPNPVTSELSITLPEGKQWS
ncbi:MAG: hypothetical protein NZ108_03430, partial [Bacteroidia bacterium]|nr:hypothetical protein [Bacteroidia bacterium]